MGYFYLNLMASQGCEVQSFLANYLRDIFGCLAEQIAGIANGQDENGNFHARHMFPQKTTYLRY